MGDDADDKGPWISTRQPSEPKFLRKYRIGHSTFGVYRSNVGHEKLRVIDRYVQLLFDASRLRRSTYRNLMSLKDGRLTKKLGALLSRDPLAPVLEDSWYPALERRLKLIISKLDKCIAARGQDGVLVDDTSATWWFFYRIRLFSFTRPRQRLDSDYASKIIHVVACWLFTGFNEIKRWKNIAE